MAEQVKTRMVAAEFAQLPETNQHMELINGVVVMSPSPIDRHQDVVVQLVLLLGQIRHDGKVVVAPMDVYLDDVNVYQPDVFWLAANSQCVSRDGYYHGAPDLIVEVLSPRTAKVDRQDKYQVYERCGVCEYWIADPSYAIVEVWRLEAGQFIRQGIYEHTDSFESQVLGTTITLTAIFPEIA